MKRRPVSPVSLSSSEDALSGESPLPFSHQDPSDDLTSRRRRRRHPKNRRTNKRRRREGVIGCSDPAVLASSSVGVPTNQWSLFSCSSLLRNVKKGIFTVVSSFAAAAPPFSGVWADVRAANLTGTTDDLMPSRMGVRSSSTLSPSPLRPLDDNDSPLPVGDPQDFQDEQDSDAFSHIVMNGTVFSAAAGATNIGEMAASQDLQDDAQDSNASSHIVTNGTVFSAASCATNNGDSSNSPFFLPDLIDNYDDLLVLLGTLPPNLLEPDLITNHGFLVEEFKDSYFFLSPLEQKDLVSGGKMFTDRLTDYVKSIHFWPQSHKQMYLLRTAIYAHYQMMLCSVLEKVFLLYNDHGQAPPLYLYDPNLDHENETLVIRNNDSASKYVDSVPWEEYNEAIAYGCRFNKIPKNSGTVRQPATNYMDAGWSGGTTSERPETSPGGYFQPRFRLGTWKKQTNAEKACGTPRVVNPVVAQSMVACSEAAKDMAEDAVWLPPGEGPFDDPHNPDRQQQFAAQIDPKCNTETSRLHMTTPKMDCGCHVDLLNGTREAVVGLSKLLLNPETDELTHYGINSQMRKAIDNFYSNKNSQESILDRLVNAYTEFPPERRSVGNHLLDSPSASWLNGFTAIRNLATLIPMAMLSLSMTPLFGWDVTST